MGETDNKQALIDRLNALLGTETLDYRSILRVSHELSKYDEEFQRFSVDAKTLIHLGRDSIKDHSTALIELVKNSYDADASIVDVEITAREGFIRVADNGFGMTRDELLNGWLRIGFSSKRTTKVSGIGRRKTGEKGIGRISTDRLGAELELITKTETDGIIGLLVNWNDFDEDGKDVFDIDIKLTKPPVINIPKTGNGDSVSGTEIIVRNLRQPWSRSAIESLYLELATLTSPFQEVDGFSITLHTDIAKEFSKRVEMDFLKASTIELSSVFDGTNEVVYSIKDKFNKNEIVEKINLNQFFQRSQKEEDAHSSEILKEAEWRKTLSSGPMEVKLLFFLREGASVADVDFTLKDLREFLDNNNGVKIYRDNVAVKPYGFPKASFGYDWLNLGQRKVRNPAGVGRANEYKISPNQLVGAVFIARDENPLLIDSAAREGLIESEGFNDMKEFVLASLQLLESHYAKIYPSTQKVKNEKFSAHQEAEKIKAQLTEVVDDLTHLKKEIQDFPEKAIKPQTLLKPIVKSIAAVETINEEVTSTISELLHWQRVLNGLATMGISFAVFGHETEGSISQVKGSINTAKLMLEEVPPNLDVAQMELEKAIKHSKKIAAWGAYALTRVQKEKRRKRNTNIYKTIFSVVKELKPAFEAATIEIRVVGNPFYETTYPMDIESILVNLLTNAYTASTQKSNRKVVVKTDREVANGVPGFFFSVSDSGYGVAKEFAHRVFEPLFSTKTSGPGESNSIGTGLGLTIVKSIVEELSGKVSFDSDPELGGARFRIWLPKIE